MFPSYTVNLKKDGANNITYKGETVVENVGGTLFEVEKKLDGNTRVAYVLVTNQKPEKTVMKYRGKTLLTAKRELWKNEPEVSLNSENSLFKTPVFSYLSVFSIGTAFYMGASLLWGLVPFFLPSALFLMSKTYNFLDRFAKKLDGKRKYVSETKQKLFENSNDILGVVNNYLLPTRTTP